MVLFLAEISLRFNGEFHFTPSNGAARNNNVYEMDISPHPKETYWTGWGGVYDNFSATSIEVYFERFLRKVETMAELLDEPLSLFISDDYAAFINIPVHPWLYPGYSAEISHVMPFLSSALNPQKPSDNTLRGVDTQVRLSVPDFTVKLSDNINGIILNQDFQAAFHNDDGYFDDEEKWNLFNTPLYLKKAVIENTDKTADVVSDITGGYPSPAEYLKDFDNMRPHTEGYKHSLDGGGVVRQEPVNLYKRFKTIRVGLIESASTGFGSFEISASDRLRAMDSPVCGTVSAGGLPLNTVIDEKALNKNIPAVYGVKKVELIKLNETQYIAAEYVDELIAVYDSDGEPQARSYDPQTNIVTSTDSAKTAVIRGYAENRIGQVIKDLIGRKAGVRYADINWNVEEADLYISSSAPVNIAVTGGDVKTAVQGILKNDMAFLIQQNDGRFTLRKYGGDYALREIPRWTVTKKPEKSWASAQDNYFSSCVINHSFTDKETFISLLYSDREGEAEDIYRRKVQKTFDTDLTGSGDALKLARLLADRYLKMRQTVKVPLGIDTSDFELMDTVIMPLSVNGRLFSGSAFFFIKEINPAQDILTLEELEIVLLYVTGEYTYSNNHIKDFDNMYAFTNESGYEYILDGGDYRGAA